MSGADLKTNAHIKAEMQATYDRLAATWDAGRDTSFRERPWFERLLKGLSDPCKILDLGCGSGRPIAGALLAQGHRVTGIDASPEMISLAKRNFPPHTHKDASWHVMDMRSLSLPPAFDVIYSWDGFFHLSPAEQRLALPAICKLLSSKGRLMLTIGEDEGEAIGAVYGGPVFHGSLSHPEYREILAAADMHMVSVTSECFNNIQRNVLYASKIQRS